MRHLLTRSVYLFITLFSVISCRIAEKGEGYIYIDLDSGADASVDFSPATKAIIEASDDYIVEIGGESYRYGDIKNSGVELLAGTYSVKAYNCTADEAAAGKGKVRFASPVQSVELAVGQSVEVSLQCVMANSRITFSFDDEFAKEFDISKSTIEVSNTDDFSGRSVVLEDISDELYFSAGDNIYARVTAYKQGYSSPHPLVIGPYTAQAATSHNINIKYQAPVFGLSASAAHTYSGGVLTGTAVKLDVTSFSGIGASKFESWGATLTGNDNKVIRSFSSSQMPTVGVFAMTVQNGMIYLPQGTTATLSVYIKLKTGETLYFEPAEKTITIAEKPKVDVAINAETSYSRYKGGLSSANDSGTGDKVMNIGATVKIADDVLKQMNASLKFTYDGLSMLNNVDADKFKSISSANVPAETLENNTGLFNSENREIKSQAWGTHTVAASVIFDGVTKSVTQACHVTGIPYVTSLNNNTSGWTNFSNVETDNGYFIFNPDHASVLSPTFHIPSSIPSINVTITIAVYAYHTNATAEYKPKVYVSAASSPVQSGASEVITSSISLVGVEGCDDKNFDVQMSSDGKENISLYVYGKKNKGWLSGADYPEFFMNKFTLMYRL